MKTSFLILIALIIPFFFGLILVLSAVGRIRLLHERLRALAGRLVQLCREKDGLDESSHVSTPPSQLIEEAARRVADVWGREKAASPQIQINREAILQTVAAFNRLAGEYAKARQRPLARLFASSKTHPPVSPLPAPPSSHAG